MKKKTLGVIAGLMAVLLVVAGSVKLYDYLNPQEDEESELTFNVVYIENKFTFTEDEFFDNPTYSNLSGGQDFYYNTINGHKVGYTTYDTIDENGSMVHFRPFRTGPVSPGGFVIGSPLFSDMIFIKINGEFFNHYLNKTLNYDPLSFLLDFDDDLNPFIDDFNDVITFYFLNYALVKVKDIKIDDVGSYIIKDETKYYLY